MNTAFLVMGWTSGHVTEGISLTQTVAERLEDAVRLSPPKRAQIRTLKRKILVYVPAGRK